MSNEKRMFSFDFIHQPRLYKDENLARGVGKLLDELDTIFISAKSRAKAIKSSGEYTQKGKQAALVELAKQIEPQVKDWQKVIDGYQEQIRQLDAEMQPKRNRHDDVVAEMRQAEIRTYLRTLDPLDLEARFMTAVQQGDELFLAAVEESPVAFAFSTKNLIEKARFQRLSAAYPVQAQKVADLRTMQDSATSALKSVARELLKEGVQVLPDAISQSQAA